MFRYRMGSRPSRMGWVVAVFIIGLLLIILIGQLGGGQRAVSNQPAATQGGASVSQGILVRLWEDVKAGAVSVWRSMVGGGEAEQVNVSLDGVTGLGIDIVPDSTAGTGAGDDDEDDVPVPNDVTVTVVKPLQPDSFVPIGQTPQILIYHTHTHEAYTKVDGEDYVEAAKWRTVNNSFNVVKVGEALAMELSAKYGIATLQDKTDNEYPQLGTAYSRSLKTMQKDMAANSDLKILIDLHRDAYNTGINPRTVMINGRKVSRIMFVIGTGAGQTGVGFAEKPDWKKNLAVADAIKARLSQFDPQLVRDTSIKTGRYNQHLSTGAILIEIGNNEDTLEEALNAVPFLAQAIADVYNAMAEGPAATAAPTASPSATPTASPKAQAVQAASAMPQLTASGPAPQVITIQPVQTQRPRPTEEIG